MKNINSYLNLLLVTGRSVRSVRLVRWDYNRWVTRILLSMVGHTTIITNLTFTTPKQCRRPPADICQETQYSALENTFAYSYINTQTPSLPSLSLSFSLTHTLSLSLSLSLSLNLQWTREETRKESTKVNRLKTWESK
jgi:hypothetical protein